MLNKTLILAMFILFVTSCNDNAMKKMTATHPILKVEIIDVSSTGIIENLQGEIYLKKKDSNQYIKVYSNDIVNFGDILELRQGASIKINFEKGFFLVIDPVKKDSWFTFRYSDVLDNRIRK